MVKISLSFLLKFGDFINWAANQPDNYDDDEDCGHFRYGNDNGLWNDIPCDTDIIRGYICKMRKPGMFQYENDTDFLKLGPT